MLEFRWCQIWLSLLPPPIGHFGACKKIIFPVRISREIFEKVSIPAKQKTYHAPSFQSGFNHYFEIQNQKNLCQILMNRKFELSSSLKTQVEINTFEVLRNNSDK